MSGIFNTPQPKRGGTPQPEFEQQFGQGSFTSGDPQNFQGASSLINALLGQARGGTAAFQQPSSLQQTIRGRATDLLGLASRPGAATEAAFQQLSPTFQSQNQALADITLAGIGRPQSSGALSTVGQSLQQQQDAQRLFAAQQGQQGLANFTGALTGVAGIEQGILGPQQQFQIQALLQSLMQQLGNPAALTQDPSFLDIAGQLGGLATGLIPGGGGGG